MLLRCLAGCCLWGIPGSRFIFPFGASPKCCGHDRRSRPGRQVPATWDPTRLASRRGCGVRPSDVRNPWENGESQRYWGTTHGIDGWIHANFGFYHVNNPITLISRLGLWLDKNGDLAICLVSSQMWGPRSDIRIYLLYLLVYKLQRIRMISIHFSPFFTHGRKWVKHNHRITGKISTKIPDAIYRSMAAKKSDDLWMGQNVYVC